MTPFEFYKTITIMGLLVYSCWIIYSETAQLVIEKERIFQTAISDPISRAALIVELAPKSAKRATCPEDTMYRLVYQRAIRRTFVKFGVVWAAMFILSR